MTLESNPGRGTKVYSILSDFTVKWHFILSNKGTNSIF